ncbi:hypothetical protein EVAR_46429_1 [Eumeta japonica]|uniref:Uncharacterized protein n=1 Tax=Eumeta variegata TaxID=151549 RepID=A0A4C1XDR1_EUMVA|nr:hypothetical protein EVAR_46429_1 [Eumeta japonica]
MDGGIDVSVPSVTVISPSTHKPTFRISLVIVSENGFLTVWTKVMDTLNIQLLYFSTSFTCGGRSTTATDTRKMPQFIDGAPACTYELHTLHTKGHGHALHIFHVRTPHELHAPILSRTISTAPALGLLLVPLQKKVGPKFGALDSSPTPEPTQPAERRQRFETTVIGCRLGAEDDIDMLQPRDESSTPDVVRLMACEVREEGAVQQENPPTHRVSLELSQYTIYIRTDLASNAARSKALEEAAVRPGVRYESSSRGDSRILFLIEGLNLTLSTPAQRGRGCRRSSSAQRRRPGPSA